MAHELIDTVTATPTGPTVSGIGRPFNLSGIFTLNGPSGGTTSVYSLAFQKLSPGAPFAFANVDPAAPNTIITRPFTPTVLGAHTFRVVGTLVTDISLTQVLSNTVTVNVIAFHEETAPEGTWSEQQSTASTMTEQSAPASTWTEQQGTASTVTEQSAPSSTWTEQQAP